MMNKQWMTSMALGLSVALVTACGGGGGSSSAGGIGTAAAGMQESAASGSQPSKRELTLSWDAAQDESVNMYSVYLSQSPDAPPELQRKIMIPGNPEFNKSSPSTRFDTLTELKLVSGDTACFRLKAGNNNVMSEFSDPVCTTI